MSEEWLERHYFLLDLKMASLPVWVSEPGGSSAQVSEVPHIQVSSVRSHSSETVVVFAVIHLRMGKWKIIPAFCR